MCPSTAELGQHIRALADSGMSTPDVAKWLDANGISVPRAGLPHVVHDRGDSYLLPTEPGRPGTWNAPAVEAVLEATAEEPTDGYAATAPLDGSAYLVLNVPAA